MPTDREQHMKKHSMICQVDTVDFLREEHPLRKAPHAFGSELVKKPETEMACWKRPVKKHTLWCKNRFFFSCDTLRYMSSHSLTACHPIYLWLGHSTHDIMHSRKIPLSRLLRYSLLGLQHNILWMVLGTGTPNMTLIAQPFLPSALWSLVVGQQHLAMSRNTHSLL